MNPNMGDTVTRFDHKNACKVQVKPPHSKAFGLIFGTPFWFTMCRWMDQSAAKKGVCHRFRWYTKDAAGNVLWGKSPEGSIEISIRIPRTFMEIVAGSATGRGYIRLTVVILSIH
jgi:hypothetical protein